MTTPSISDLSALREVAEAYLRDFTEDTRDAFHAALGGLVSDQAKTVLAMLDHLASEKARADAAEAERDEANTFLDRERGFVSHQAETIASLTEQLAEATALLAEFRDHAYPFQKDRADTAETNLGVAVEALTEIAAYTYDDSAEKTARATLSRLEKQEGEA